MSLQNQLVFVAGGSGTVGSGVTRALLNQGATVVVPSRSTESLQTLKEKYIRKEDAERLFTIQADIGNEKDILKVKEYVLKIASENKVDFKHVVSSVGHWIQQSVSKVELSEFNEAIHTLVGAHFLVFKTFFPLLQNVENSSYTFVTGGTAEKVFDVKASIMSVGASALRGLVVAAKAEGSKSPIRVNEFYLWLMVVPFDKVEKKFQNSHFDIGTDLVNRFILSEERESTHKIDNKEMLKK
eukprot:gene9137-1226_t